MPVAHTSRRGLKPGFRSSSRPCLNLYLQAAAKRQAEAARRILEAEAKLKAEQEARMEARRAAVRARIEQEKEAQARLAAKRAALVKPPEEHQQPKEGEASVAEDPKHAMRKRVSALTAHSSLLQLRTRLQRTCTLTCCPA